MALYVVTVSRVVRDLVSTTIEVDAANREAAEAEALRQYDEGMFELEFCECLDAEPAEAYAREAKDGAA
jgi:hypothetical protein